MAKLTKSEAKLHAQACALLTKDKLTYDERRFVLENWHEGANHVNGSAGAFFTPVDLANDFAIEPIGGRTVDLCAGIGALAFHTYWRHHYNHTPDTPQKQIVCIEVNPAYVEVGKKILPEATWICADVFGVDFAQLGRFGCAISNPPFGATPRTGNGPRYTGRTFEYHLIDLASDIADYGVFIIPQMSAPFQFSGAQYYRERKSDDCQRFEQQTGIHLSAGCGVDCNYHKDGWKGVAPSVEIVCADFEQIVRAAPAAPAQRDLFAA